MVLLYSRETPGFTSLVSIVITLINCFQLPRRRPLLLPPEGGTHHGVLRQGMHELRG